MRLPELGPAIPRRGSAVLRGFGRAMLALLRWRVEGEVPNLSKFVIVVAPHTSNWDFVIGASAMFALDLDLAFLGKHTLFRGPFAPILRWMGGIPVNRSSAHGVVPESVRAFAAVDRRILALAPQGTRHGEGRFKSGFLHIARGAGVPILLAALDYDARCVCLGPVIEPGDDAEDDLARVEARFADVRGKRARKPAAAEAEL
jgi:1-acyl-sn-glycerol-3-phosphate acyltransferase